MDTPTIRVGALYENNVVTDNNLRGIQHEISFAAIIRNNVVERNDDVYHGQPRTRLRRRRSARRTRR